MSERFGFDPVDATANLQDGVWELRLRLPKVGYPEDSSYELAGVQPLFFLSKDKYWLSK